MKGIFLLSDDVGNFGKTFHLQAKTNLRIVTNRVPKKGLKELIISILDEILEFGLP